MNTYAELAKELEAHNVRKMWNQANVYVEFCVKVAIFKRLMETSEDLFDPDMTQNDSPTLGNFIKILKDEDLIEGYVITEARKDARITVTGAVSESSERLNALEKKALMPADEKSPDRVWWD